MGAWKSVEHQKVRRLDEAIKSLKEESYTIIGVETSKESRVIYNVQLPQRSAFLFGNERFGLSALDLKECDLVVSLPMFGLKNSLNVNAALTTCGYEWVRQNGDF